MLLVQNLTYDEGSMDGSNNDDNDEETMIIMKWNSVVIMESKNYVIYN